MKIFFYTIAFFAMCSVNAQNAIHLPYINNFEDQTTGWLATGDWEHGIISAIKGGAYNNSSSAWVTKLNGEYSINETSYLTTPAFDLSTAVDPFISFQMNFYSEYYDDQMIVEYSTDSLNWSPLSAGQRSSNWGSSWAGYGNWYREIRNSLDQISGNKSHVRFRFKFSSDNDFNRGKGFIIDEFIIADYGSTQYNDVELIGLTFRNKNNCSQNPLGAYIQSRSTSPMNGYNIYLKYQVDNNLVYSQRVSRYLYRYSLYYIEFNVIPALGNVKAWVEYIPDMNKSNDTSTVVNGASNFYDFAITSTNLPPTIECSDEKIAITVDYLNLGSNASILSSLSYQINNKVPVLESINSMIPTNCNGSGNNSYTFNDSLTLSESGTYIMKIWLHSNQDTISRNDTLYHTINFLARESLPFFDGFEKNSALPKDSLFTVNIPKGWKENTNWGNSTNWQVRSELPGTTQNNGNYSYGGRGNFLYYNYNPSSFPSRSLISSCIDIPNSTENIYLDFYLRKTNLNNGYLDVIISDDNSFFSESFYYNSLTEIYSRKSINLNNFKGKTIRITLAGRSGSMAIDNFSIYRSNEYDLAIGDLISPVSSVCNTSNSNKATISLTNQGTNTISSLEVCYSLNQQDTICEILTNGSIEPNQTINYTFNSSLALGSVKSNDLLVFLKSSNDTTFLNDSLRSRFYDNTMYLPIFDDLNNENNQPNWSSNFYSYAWKLDSNATSSFNTGPDSDADGNNGLFYYAESFNPNSNGEDATLYSNRCLNASLNQNILLEFDYHMYGSSINKLEIFYYQFDIASYTEYPIVSILGEQQISSSDDWKRFSIVHEIDSSIDGEYYIGFRAVKNFGEQADIAIDNISLRDSIVNLSNFTNSDYRTLNAYPNPSAGILTISKLDVASTSGIVSLRDLRGKLVKEVEADLSQDFRINLNNVENGIYLLNVIVADKTYHQKIQILK